MEKDRPENLRKHKTTRPGWSNYFKEFIMLFLAVFLGFMAENYRAFLDEKSDEKEYIQSYIEDLKLDTAAIAKNQRLRVLKISRLDSFMKLLSLYDPAGHEKDLYFFGRIMMRTTSFQPNDQTITQLRQSGGLHTIHNRQAADSIMSYQKYVETILLNQVDEAQERKDAFPLLARLFDPFVFETMLTTKGIQRPTENFPLRSFDLNARLDAAHQIHLLRGSYYFIYTKLEELKRKAERTILFLEKEYHLH